MWEHSPPRCAKCTYRRLIPSIVSNQLKTRVLLSSDLELNGNWNYYDGAQPPYNPFSPPERVYDFVGTAPIDFSSPTVFNGAYFSGYSYVTVTFELFNGVNLVWTSATLAPSATPTWLASGYSGLMTEVDVVSPSPDFFVMDDFTYGGSSTPEPGTLGLLATGAIGALGVIRRRFAN